MNRSKRVLRGLVAGVGALALATITGAGAAGATSAEVAGETGPRQDDFLSAFFYSQQHPNAVPPGANDFSCAPGPARPDPVVLVHGTFENRYDNWAGLAPELSERGYCVFALNYGGEAGNPIRGTEDITGSARELSGFVDRVLEATGASEVDLVGHSQGGMMPRYYLKNLGGAPKVDSLIGLVPSNHGTTLHGLDKLGSFLPEGTPPCASCTQQLKDSDFITELNSGGETDPTVEYTNIATEYDEVVTPHTSSFLEEAPNVTNRTLQDFCPADLTEHVGISYNSAAQQLVLNALNPDEAERPEC
ncbi:triacylglycerol esterase/lipase EstA (alpha/beta hydrolase family) [Actinopolyspora biskrensis]|uniref:Triacylglycerol esterase/lipase EstA (Alpha/beta hydrolase family) n=1 Tax=Actinopolyspora biskrensis TaxID=1470178 RepID=A0A852Z7K8_9ACTN|nr:alpha/beta fold hydrolase [Actinopolyspora biskrensis]NYH79546.1 triacylglycerol esterase/lipase EstA (alpha/beta hydrolase family) [Actinopolyspora biskrensis]